MTSGRAAKRPITGRLTLGLVTAGLLLATSGCGGSSNGPHASETNAAAAGESGVVVRVQAAQKRAISQTVSALGRCEALPQRLALLTPAVEGQVEMILVEQGQQVAAGQVIVQFDSVLAKADLAEKEAARASLVASLKLLESLPRDKEQEASKLAIEQAKVAVVRAEALAERLRPLRARNEIAEQQMFEAEQALAQARIQHQASAAQLEALVLGPRPEAVAEAQAKIQVAEQAVKIAQARLELHALRAPIEGVLDSLTCRPGQTIAPGAAIGAVVDNRQVLATAWLPVGNGQRIQVGQTARVRVASSAATASARPGQQGEIAGRVVFRSRVADTQTGNLRVHVLVDNSHDELVVGQTIEVAIDVAPPTELLAVPLTALHDEGEGAAVTAVRDGKAVVLHPETGLSDAGWVAVSGIDLQAGEPVIVAGAYNLPDGAAVKVEVAEQGAQP